jgi:hypothetical protein
MPLNAVETLVPKPPPPRPAAREGAIGMALRRFDGADERPAARAERSWTRKPQFGLLVTASLAAAIGLPAILIALQNNDLQHAPTPQPKVAFESRQDSRALATRPKPPPPERAEPASAPPASVHRREVGVPIGNSAGQVPPPPAVMAAPPPPPTAPMLAEKSVADSTVNDVVVTGSLIASPQVASRTGGSESKAGFEAREAAADGGYPAFLKRLQTAVRENDKDAVTGLIRYPLRVNANGQSRSYPDAQAVRADYDEIFTRRVRQAILAQRSDALFVRDLGAMIGDGQVWFDHVCPNEACSPAGPVRLTAINP